MASSKDRQRKLARAKLDRQMARRAAGARRKRQVRAGIGAGLAMLLVVVGSLWMFGAFDSDPKQAAAEDSCAWTAQPADGNANLKDVGTPPTEGLPTEGTRPMTVSTNSGDIVVELDVTTSPCGTASLAHLASKNYYDGTNCHELTERFLRCGDATGTGQGGPTYTFPGENVPSAPEPTPTASAAATPPPQAPQYPRGTVALVPGTAPGNYGAQFVIFHKDLQTPDPTYSIVGRVTGGLEVLDKIVAAGTVNNSAKAKVKPAKDVTVKKLSVGEVAGQPGQSPAATPTATSEASPAPSTSARS